MNPLQTFPKVSILISCRNESENIQRLTEELKSIQYSDLEIILVDDRSEDQTFQLIKFASTLDRRIVAILSPGEGKKAALDYAVSQANGEIILCTDADCSFPLNWVEGMISPFERKATQLVAGPVMVTDHKRFLGAFQQEDWGSILLLTAYYFSKKKPLMCSAANLAYRKSAFQEVHGYEGNRNFSSGDDEFLLKKIGKTFGNESCVYLPFEENLVRTKSESTWIALINQRVRWAGKWKAHQSFSHAASAVFALFSQLVWLGTFGLLTLRLPGVFMFGLVWAFKVLAEKRSLGKVLSNIGINHRKTDFVWSSLLHPFYVLAVGLGAIMGNFIWKGRRNNRSV